MDDWSDFIDDEHVAPSLPDQSWNASSPAIHSSAGRELPQAQSDYHLGQVVTKRNGFGFIRYVTVLPACMAYSWQERDTTGDEVYFRFTDVKDALDNVCEGAYCKFRVKPGRKGMAAFDIRSLPADSPDLFVVRTLLISRRVVTQKQGKEQGVVGIVTSLPNCQRQDYNQQYPRRAQHLVLGSLQIAEDSFAFFGSEDIHAGDKLCSGDSVQFDLFEDVIHGVLIACHIRLREPWLERCMRVTPHPCVAAGVVTAVDVRNGVCSVDAIGQKESLQIPLACICAELQPDNYTDVSPEQLCEAWDASRRVRINIHDSIAFVVLQLPPESCSSEVDWAYVAAKLPADSVSLHELIAQATLGYIVQPCAVKIGQQSTSMVRLCTVPDEAKSYTDERDGLTVPLRVQDVRGRLDRLRIGDIIQLDLSLDRRDDNLVASNAKLVQLSPITSERGSIVALRDSFGFIKPRKKAHRSFHRSEQVYFHISSLLNCTFDELRVGDEVCMEVAISRRGGKVAIAAARVWVVDESVEVATFPQLLASECVSVRIRSNRARQNDAHEIAIISTPQHILSDFSPLWKDWPRSEVICEVEASLHPNSRGVVTIPLPLIDPMARSFCQNLVDAGMLSLEETAEELVLQRQAVVNGTTVLDCIQSACAKVAFPADVAVQAAQCKDATIPRVGHEVEFELGVDFSAQQVAVKRSKRTRGIVTREPRVPVLGQPKFEAATNGQIAVCSPDADTTAWSAETVVPFAGTDVARLSDDMARRFVTPILCEGDTVELYVSEQAGTCSAMDIMLVEAVKSTGEGIVTGKGDDEVIITPCILKADGNPALDPRGQAMLYIYQAVPHQMNAPYTSLGLGDLVSFTRINFARRAACTRVRVEQESALPVEVVTAMVQAITVSSNTGAKPVLPSQRGGESSFKSQQFQSARGPDGTKGFVHWD